MTKPKETAPRCRNKGAHGRPETRVRELARQYTAEAIEKLAKLLNDGNTCVQVAAAQALLDRGFGRVPQVHNRLGRQRQAESKEMTVNITRFDQKGETDAERV